MRSTESGGARLRARASRFGAALVATGALVGVLGCGIGASVTDVCTIERDSYHAAQKRVDGMRSRGLRPEDPTFDMANANARKTLEILRTCEAG
jgi:hypothetical protein